MNLYLEKEDHLSFKYSMRIIGLKKCTQLIHVHEINRFFFFFYGFFCWLGLFSRFNYKIREVLKLKIAFKDVFFFYKMINISF